MTRNNHVFNSAYSRTKKIYKFSRDATGSVETVNFSVGGAAVYLQDYLVMGATTFTTTAGSITFDIDAFEHHLVIYPIGEAPLPIIGKDIIITITGVSDPLGYAINTPVNSDVNYNPTGVIRKIEYSAFSRDTSGYPTGILYYLGSNGATTSYTNVATSGIVSTYASSINGGFANLYGPNNVFNYKVTNYSNPYLEFPPREFLGFQNRFDKFPIFMSEDISNSFFIFKFNNNYSVKPNMFAVVPGREYLYESYVLKVYGSNNLATVDGPGAAAATWDLILDFQAPEIVDTAFLIEQDGGVVPVYLPVNTFYSAFKFEQYGLAVDQQFPIVPSNIFRMSNFDMYGTLKQS